MYHETLSEILVFKTNILRRQDVEILAAVLNGDSRVRRWNIDLADIDHVLRVETEDMCARDIIGVVANAGFQCEELPD
jgi:hypothetical protein